jgi:hypothetical protein
MSNMLEFFEAAGGDREPRGMDEVRALTAAEIDNVAGGVVRICVHWSDGTVTCHPYVAPKPN